ncbi:MAG: ribbon-helix-helix protein, CopG family [Gemmatimonadaceae bacterium]
MRTIIEIPEHILSRLDEEAERHAISRAEAVRWALTEYLARRTTPRTDAAFGVWKSKPVDPLAHEDSIRNEWRG